MALVFLAVPRVLLLTVVEVIAAAACLVAQAGADPSQPLSRWRRGIITGVVPGCTRVALMCAGFWVLIHTCIATTSLIAY